MVLVFDEDDDDDEVAVAVPGFAESLAVRGELLLESPLLINKFKMGRGTGHLAVLVVPAALRASSACFSAAAANLKLKFNFSSLGQHLANSIRRTARLEALLSACVKDIVWGVAAVEALSVSVDASCDRVSLP